MLEVKELPRDRLAVAWPLARTVARHGNLESWQAAADLLIERGGGIIAAEAHDGLLYGMATYEAVDTPRAGRVLQVDTLVAFELSRKAPVRRVLSDALDRLAQRLACASVAVALPNRGFVASRARPSVIPSSG
ncbi:MAG: hypothetical protein V4444_01645 [Pseudomonadota bacterium]